MLKLMITNCFMQDSRSYDMTMTAIEERYMYMTADLADMEWHARNHGTWPELIAARAAMESLAAIVFRPFPGVPMFPWAPR